MNGAERVTSDLHSGGASLHGDITDQQSGSLDSCASGGLVNHFIQSFWPGVTPSAVVREISDWLPRCVETDCQTVPCLERGCFVVHSGGASLHGGVSDQRVR